MATGTGLRIRVTRKRRRIVTRGLSASITAAGTSWCARAVHAASCRRGSRAVFAVVGSSAIRSRLIAAGGTVRCRRFITWIRGGRVLATRICACSRPVAASPIARPAVFRIVGVATGRGRFRRAACRSRLSGSRRWWQFGRCFVRRPAISLFCARVQPAHAGKACQTTRRTAAPSCNT